VLEVLRQKRREKKEKRRETNREKEKRERKEQSIFEVLKSGLKSSSMISRLNAPFAPEQKNKTKKKRIFCFVCLFFFSTFPRVNLPFKKKTSDYWKTKSTRYQEKYMSIELNNLVCVLIVFVCVFLVAQDTIPTLCTFSLKKRGGGGGGEKKKKNKNKNKKKKRKTKKKKR